MLINKQLINEMLYGKFQDKPINQALLVQIKATVHTYLKHLEEIKQIPPVPFEVICDSTNNTPESIADGRIVWDVVLPDWFVEEMYKQTDGGLYESGKTGPG
jgi:phage tail sheath protein FI